MNFTDCGCGYGRAEPQRVEKMLSAGFVKARLTARAWPKEVRLDLDVGVVLRHLERSAHHAIWRRSLRLLGA